MGRQPPVAGFGEPEHFGANGPATSGCRIRRTRTSRGSFWAAPIGNQEIADPIGAKLESALISRVGRQPPVAGFGEAEDFGEIADPIEAKLEHFGVPFWAAPIGNRVIADPIEVKPDSVLISRVGRQPPVAGFGEAEDFGEIAVPIGAKPDSALRRPI